MQGHSLGRRGQAGRPARPDPVRFVAGRHPERHVRFGVPVAAVLTRAVPFVDRPQMSRGCERRITEQIRYGDLEGVVDPPRPGSCWLRD